MWYILDENNLPIKADIKDYIKWDLKNYEKRIVKQENINDVRVSTVFLGLDHSYNENVPVLWETMIFGGEHNLYQERYSSYEGALEGHERAVLLVKINNN
jgi:hypothetical protein